MEESFDFVLTKFNDNLREEILRGGFPSWHKRYSDLFRSGDISEENVYRKDWSDYVSKKIHLAKERLIFNLCWPLMPVEMRKNILASLQGALVRGVEIASFFQAQTTVPASSLNLPMQFSNSEDINRVDPTYIEKKPVLSFLIIDNDVLFEAPAQPYHNCRKFYYASSVKESLLKHIFSDFF